ncbi:GNAT family N-acetyltransferase [Sphingosinicella sp. CPCC 101087]|uniref:GNAT family N-acetyltransferase n=1 Tax=Sphingosinicella sp. CPCC 101087 TaxID=2497754 RepID=UPI00101D9443|nr:GNAT family N-acetyltransferase [Sphingosinicella sp. CPCC 101087]
MGKPADEIRTERLLLRRARPGDLAAIHAILGHPRAMRYWSTPPHRSLGETREWLESMIAAPPGESEDFVIEHEGQVIGKAGCWRLPEIGYILHPGYWGRGLAREALAAVIPRLFARFAIPAITADVDPRNLPSLALLRRLGFVETGRAERTWLIGNEYCDSIYLALPRKDGPPDAEAKTGNLRAPDGRR